MSLLTPVKVPVKVYRWDDAGAPALDKTAGCMMTIFKACLVTGYGTKTGAGWTMPFGDVTAGVKILQPDVGAQTQWQLKLSGDTGRGMSAQIYIGMTSADTGIKKVELELPFSYGAPVTNGKWMLIATSKTVWFFAEAQHTGDDKLPADKGGTYIIAGSVASDIGDDCVYMRHTAGSWGATWGQRYGIMYQTKADKGGAVSGILYDIAADVTTNRDPFSAFSGQSNLNSIAINSPLYVAGNNKVCQLPIFGSSKNTLSNFDAVTGKIDAINFGTTTFGSPDNICVPTDVWVY